MKKFDIPTAIRNLRGRDHHVLPPVRIGDIVRFKETAHSYVALITFEVSEEHKDDDNHWFGGVRVGGTYTEPVWVNMLSWLLDPDAYTVIGHIDLTQATQRTSACGVGSAMPYAQC